ncbi:MAG: beta-lactamase family protein [Deltaproteobacteria bacterium]|nr:beta-lactamase family protein [Deltaproteobacteria bacterium]
MEEAIESGTVAGGVVAVGTRTGVFLQKAYGNLSSEPGAEPLREDAVFDVASLTKVLATAPVIVLLAEEGRIGLSDPVVRWLPELRGGGKEKIRVIDLLTHGSGLSDREVPSSIEGLLGALAGRRVRGPTGTRFRYADVNFVLLGEIARRAGGARLDELARRAVYEPLGMEETTFLPTPAATSRCAPTLGDRGRWSAGTVQDPTARRLGGVAGHAGLFTTAGDLALFCRMMLSGGTLEGRRVLSEQSVGRMTSPTSLDGGAVTRGLGWDISSPYSAPRSGFGGRSYGHTAYSGASVWLDPAADRFVVLLTARVNYREPRRLNALRAAISEVAARLAPGERPALGDAER